MVSHVDVTIVGAGPAGSMAALGCARAGLKAVLLEKEKMPRLKACGGGLESNYLDGLKKDVPNIEKAIERRYGGVALFRRRKKLASLPFGMCCFMRDRFDHFLARAAEEEGALFLNGDGCTGIIEKEDFVKVKTASGKTFRSKALVGADGYGGTVSRSAGLFAGNHEIAACIDIEARPPKNAIDEPAIFIGYSNMEGYAWAFPKIGTISLGMGTLCPNPNLNIQFSRFLKENGFSRLKVVKRLGAVLPMKVLPRICKGRVLLAGDAAGLVDRLGGGIPYALESGRIAGRVVAEAVESWDFSRLQEYDRLCRKAFWTKFAFAGFRAVLLSAVNTLSSPFSW